MSSVPKRGLGHQLYHFLRKNGGWVAKGAITDIKWYHNSGRKTYGKRYLPETVGRELRILEEASLIAVKDDGVSVQYKYIPEPLRPRYIPTSHRPVSAKEKLFQ